MVASLVLTASSRSQKDSLDNLKKLMKMVKPGGRIMIYEAGRSGSYTEEGFYVVGDAKFIDAAVTSDFVSKALNSAGFDDIVCLKNVKNVLNQMLRMLIRVSWASFSFAKKKVEI